MKDRYSLKYYLSLHPTEAEIVSTFWQLDKQMKYLHERGYYVPDINSDTILKENNIFVFESIKKNDDRDENISSNILELATLAIDSFISAGFDSIQDVRISDYYQRVVIDGVRNEYLSTSLESAESMNQESKKDSKTYIKRYMYDRMKSEREKQTHILVHMCGI